MVKRVIRYRHDAGKFAVPEFVAYEQALDPKAGAIRPG
jgi:hypothetical protein